MDRWLDFGLGIGSMIINFHLCRILTVKTVAIIANTRKAISLSISTCRSGIPIALSSFNFLLKLAKVHHKKAVPATIRIRNLCFFHFWKCDILMLRQILKRILLNYGKTNRVYCFNNGGSAEVSQPQIWLYKGNVYSNKSKI